MRFDVITLFPELFEPFFKSGITRRAFESKQVDVRLWNPRDFAEGNYRRVDDRPFGGGPGMVMMAEPLWLCLQAIRADRAETDDAHAPVVLFSPIGQRLDHAGATQWAASTGAVLVCGCGGPGARAGGSRLRVVARRAPPAPVAPCPASTDTLVANATAFCRRARSPAQLFTLVAAHAAGLSVACPWARKVKSVPLNSLWTHTMNRCARRPMGSRGLALAAALTCAFALVSPPSQAQHRAFPDQAMRGQMVVGTPPSITITNSSADCVQCMADGLTKALWLASKPPARPATAPAATKPASFKRYTG